MTEKRIAFLEDRNTARLDCRMPPGLLSDVQREAELLGISANVYAKIVFAIATGQAPGLERVFRVARTLTAGRRRS